MSPQNSSTKAQASGHKSTHASTGSEGPLTPSQGSRLPTDISETRYSDIKSGKGVDFAMQRWLGETPEEEPWSGISRLGGDVDDAVKEEGEGADGGLGGDK